MLRETQNFLTLQHNFSYPSYLECSPLSSTAFAPQTGTPWVLENTEWNRPLLNHATSLSQLILKLRRLRVMVAPNLEVEHRNTSWEALYDLEARIISELEKVDACCLSAWKRVRGGEIRPGDDQSSDPLSIFTEDQECSSDTSSSSGSSDISSIKESDGDSATGYSPPSSPQLWPSDAPLRQSLIAGLSQHDNGTDSASDADISSPGLPFRLIPIDTSDSEQSEAGMLPSDWDSDAVLWEYVGPLAVDSEV